MQFITVTDQTDGRTRHVRIDAIESFVEINGGSALTTCGAAGSVRRVVESPAQIVVAIRSRGGSFAPPVAL